MVLKHGVLTSMYEIYFKTDSNKISVWELPTLFKLSDQYFITHGPIMAPCTKTNISNVCTKISIIAE